MDSYVDSALDCDNEHVESAHAAGLHYVTDEMPGIRRLPRGRGFSYVGTDGLPIRDRAELDRIRKLVIPPRWTDVWICPHASGHLQVTARDARGRKQYRYHPRYREIRDETKFGRMIAFSEVLPGIREHVERDIARTELSRDKVLAVVVWLLEKTLIRVGKDAYARDNGSFGLTTLRRRHVAVSGSKLRFEFKGKSGVPHSVAVTDRRIARIVQRCQELPGQELFQYLDDDGRRQSVDADDINQYLRQITGRQVTAKDFRTWAGTMLAATALREIGPFDSEKQARANIVRAIDQVAKRLGNTRTICRKYYVHPVIVEAYMDGFILPPAEGESGERVPAGGTGALRRDEVAVVQLLRERSKTEPIALARVESEELAGIG
ncbi:MAG: DNA topoisomerase IB, partial [Gemmatimonadaceae bacterium]